MSTGMCVYVCIYIYIYISLSLSLVLVVPCLYFSKMKMESNWKWSGSSPELYLQSFIKKHPMHRDSVRRCVALSSVSLACLEDRHHHHHHHPCLPPTHQVIESNAASDDRSMTTWNHRSDAEGANPWISRTLLDLLPMLSRKILATPALPSSIFIQKWRYESSPENVPYFLVVVGVPDRQTDKSNVDV